MFKFKKYIIIKIPIILKHLLLLFLFNVFIFLYFKHIICYLLKKTKSTRQ